MMHRKSDRIKDKDGKQITLNQLIKRAKEIIDKGKENKNGS